MTKEVPEHIQRHRVGRASAALPGWAAGKFTDAQAAVMGPVGIEMLNKRGVCALHLKVIADAAGVSVGTARDTLNMAHIRTSCRADARVAGSGARAGHARRLAPSAGK
jgi:hypothetical protein